MVSKDKLTGEVIAACFEIHNELGLGFNEKTYQNALKIALEKRRIKYLTEKLLSVKFQGKNVGNFRVDFIIEGRVILEIKAVSGPLPKVYEAQVISYLRTSGLGIGLLVNFGTIAAKYAD